MDPVRRVAAPTIDEERSTQRLLGITPRSLEAWLRGAGCEIAQGEGPAANGRRPLESRQHRRNRQHCRFGW